MGDFPKVFVSPEGPRISSDSATSSTSSDSATSTEPSSSPENSAPGSNSSSSSSSSTDSRTNSELPLFLRASDPSTWKKPDDISWGDYSLNPNRPLSARHRRFAQLVARGATAKEIKEELGYDDSWISRLKSNSRIKEEIDRCLDRLFEEDIEERLKRMGPDAANVMEDILRDEMIPLTKKENAARWVLEKLTGKPAQQIDYKGEVSVGVFLDKLDELKERIEVNPEREVKELQGELVEETVDEFDKWLDENL